MKKKNKQRLGKLCLMLGTISAVALAGSLIDKSAKADTYYVDSVESFATALSKDGIKNIVLTNDFSINQTLQLNGEINISSNADVTITRDSSFLGDIFVVGINADVSFGQTENYTLIFDGNSVSSEGVVFRTSENSSLQLNKGIEITKFDSVLSGTVVANYGELIIDGCSIYGNTMSDTNDKYGIIHCYEDSSFQLKSGFIYNNTTTNTGILFINNDSAFEMSGGEIYNNSSTVSGGGVFIKSATAKFTGGKIYSNSTAANGGGIYLKDKAKVEITGTEIYDNQSSEYGAGLFLTDNAYLKLNGGTIKNNTSSKSGAGLFVTGSSKFDMLSGTIISNQNESGNGGAFVNKSIANIYGGTITENTASSKGGAIYNDGGTLYIENASITKNTASSFGGAICNDSGTLTITSGTFTENSTEDDGGAICGYSSSKTTISGGQFIDNTAKDRGHDVYGAASSTSKYSTITLTGGEIDYVNIQYCKLELGGSIKINEKLTTNAGPKANYAHINIISEIENKILITPHSKVVAETQDSEVKFIRYNANDDYSNIYRSARNIEFSNDLYTVVENDTILVQTGEYKIDIANDCVINAPLAAAENETISFTTFAEYSISNLTITAKDGTAITPSVTNGVWSFTMPAQNVTIDYDFALTSLALTVDSSISSFVEVGSTYKFKEKVDVTIKTNDNSKLTALYINYKQKTTQLEIKDGKASFAMFNGATLTGEVKNYYDISFQKSDYIQTINLESEKLNKGLVGEEILFTIQTKTTGDALRYAVKRVYYISNQQEVDITKNQEAQYNFIMPEHNVEIKIEFVDVFAQIEGAKTTIFTEAELKAGLTGENKILILCQDITLTETIVVGEGEYTIVSLGDHKISRSNLLKTNMFEVGYKSILNFSLDNDAVGLLTIDGNSQSVQGTTGSAIFAYESGIININKNTIISNHKLENVNYNYTAKGQGNAHAGGSAVYNYHGVVNMYGGTICNNYSTQNGSAVYNYGRFNLYGGTICNNTGKDGGTIYNIRVFNQEGGVIENNSTEAYGGAIYNASSYYAYIYLVGGEVKNNSALISGGAYYIGEKSVAFCKGGLISGNSALKNGGAINSKGTLFAQGTNFEDNVAGSKGGAIYGYLNPIFVRGGIFTNNSANSGGAICVNDGAELEITAGEFNSNIAEERGGAVYLAGDKELRQPTTANVIGAYFTGNTASEGDAICVQYAVLKLGGSVLIEGTVETVANPTANYGYIQFVSMLDNQVEIKPNKYYDDYQLEDYNVLRVAEDVDATQLKDKIVISNSSYLVKVEDNQLYIYKA